MNNYIRTLMNRMTLEEKIGQLNLVTPGGSTTTGAVASEDVETKIRAGQVGGLFGIYTPTAIRIPQEIAVKGTRLGIPLLFGLDVIHGHKTVFPIPLGLSCTWDMALIEKSARLAAIEACADGLSWVFSPMVDIARDPRWGRIAETAGEDPYLGSLIARAMVRGYQGDDLSRPDTVMACVKHFALYGAAEGGRDYNTTDMSRIKMYEYYLPPYKAAVDAGVGSIMCSFNEIDGIPATGNKWLMTDLLRSEWGFEGLAVSDYTGINEMTAHGMGDLKTVAALALQAGTDMDMVGEGFLTTLEQSLKDGTVSMAEIDQACQRILEAKYKLGLFDDPYRYIDESGAVEKILTPEHRAAARDMAARACVLLKNDGQVLPLKKAGTIAVIGPLANDKKNMLGTWSIAGDWEKSVSVLEGIQNATGGHATVLHAKGANITNDPLLAQRLNFAGDKVEIDPRAPAQRLTEAVECASQADVIVAVVGEAQEMSGEASSRADISIPQDQRELLRALVATGKPLVLVVVTGRPLTLTWEQEHAAAILVMWFGGTEAGNGVADILFGACNPSGKLTATFPRHVGQIPIYYNHKNTGRPYAGEALDKFKSRYLDVPNAPLYPFGYGLSYTSFAYSDIKLNKTECQGCETLRASVTLTNTGIYAGAETVQLYISDPVASVTRSVKDLRGFQKVFLQPAEAKEIIFEITTEDLKFFNTELLHVWEEGEFIIHIGTHSNALQSASVQWKK
jgi:beta-glucosidase